MLRFRFRFRHLNLKPTHLLLAVVLAQVQEVKDVRVPGLDVDGKGALALAAALVHIPGFGVTHISIGVSMHQLNV